MIINNANILYTYIFPAVGKSSSVERFVRNEFFEYQQPTIGAAFLTQTVQLDDVIIKFEIWVCQYKTMSYDK